MREKLETVARNLKWLAGAERECGDIRAGIMHAAALAVGSVHDTLPSPTEIWEIYSEMAGDRPRSVDFVSLISELCRLYNPPTDDILTDEADRAVIPAGTVSYVKNPVTDKTYKALSSGGRLKALYASDFKAACEDVYYDRAEYCILPLENSSDGLLYAFRRLADKYGLRIVSAVKVATGDDENLTAALLSSDAHGHEHGDTHEFSVPSDAPWSVSELLEALTAIGASAARINYIPSPHGDGKFDAHLCIKYSGDISPLILFFTSAYPSCTYYGSYNTIGG